MEKILVSACLLGDKVRYDGGSNPVSFLDELSKHFQIVPFCPEVEGGLSIPREPAEIVGASVLTKSGKDVTKNYQDGAEKALNLCKFFGIRYAILKDGSPACGPRQIHDGKFDGLKKDGLGVTANLLVASGIKVFAETDNISFLWGKPTEKKTPVDQKKKKKFGAKKPRTLAEANEMEAEKKEREAYKAAHPEEFVRKEHTGYRKGSYTHSSYHKDNADGSYEKKPYGERKSYGEKRSYGDKKPFGHSSYGHSSYGHSSYNKKPYGEHSSYHKEGEGTSYEKKPYSGHSSYQGSKPYGDKKPYGNRKPYGDHKSYGDKKPYGDRKSYGDKKPYGDHKSYGDKKPYGDRKSYGDKKPYGHSSYGHSSYGKKSYGEGGYKKKSYGHSSYSGKKSYSDKPSASVKKDGTK